MVFLHFIHDALPVELVSRVLQYLRARDLSGISQCCTRYHQLLHDELGALPRASSSFQRLAKDEDLAEYQGHRLFHLETPTNLNSCARILLNMPVVLENNLCTQKMICKILKLLREDDASEWITTRHGVHYAKASGQCTLYQAVLWDFWIWKLLLATMKHTQREDFQTLHIRSLPMLAYNTPCNRQVLYYSSSIFLVNFLAKLPKGKRGIALCIKGTMAPLRITHAVPSAELDRSRQEVYDLLMTRSEDLSQELRMLTQTIFRSDTVNIGVVLCTAHVPLCTFELSFYLFNEENPLASDVSLLCDFLTSPYCHTLRRIKLYCLYFEHGIDFVLLCKMLTRVQSLTALSVATVRCRTDTVEDPLFYLLASGPNIRRLNISQIERGDQEMHFEVLRPTIRSLSLTRMYVDVTTATSLFSCIPYVHGLCELNLSHNALDSQVFVLVGAVLENKTCVLRNLNLASNILTPMHIRHLVEGLQKNRTLHKLNMCDNFLGVSGLYSLLMCMTQPYGSNTTLRALFLDNNQIRLVYTELMKAVTELGHHHDAFRLLSLRYNHVQTHTIYPHHPTISVYI